MKEKNSRVEIDQSLPEKKKKKKKNNNLAHLFSSVVGIVSMSISGVDLWHRHSLSLPSRPIQFLVCGFCVFEEE